MQESSKSIQIEAFHVFKVLQLWYSTHLKVIILDPCSYWYFLCQNSYLLLTKINQLILSAYSLQTKVRCWDYWTNSKSIKVSDAIYWIVSCFFLYQIFSDDNMFVAIVQRMNSSKLTKPRWWRKLLLLKHKD